MAARFQNLDDTNTEWDFVIADSYYSLQAMERARAVILYKTTIHLRTGQMDCSDPMAPEAQTSATFTKLTASACICTTRNRMRLQNDPTHTNR